MPLVINKKSQASQCEQRNSEKVLKKSCETNGLSVLVYSSIKMSLRYEIKMPITRFIFRLYVHDLNILEKNQQNTACVQPALQSPQRNAIV